MTNPPEWLDRVLSYDDLPEEERAEVREFLAQNEDARGLLERVRRAESDAVPAGALPGETPPMSTSETLEADASLALLLRRTSAASPERRIVVALKRPRVFVPALAAAAVLLLVLLPERAREPLVGSFGTFPPSGVRGEDVRTDWETGDPFVLRCDLARASALLLVHVDPEGGVDVLIPATDADREATYGPGPVELPGADEEWIFEGATGKETFLLAVRNGRAASDDWNEVTSRVRRVADARTEREERLAELRRVVKGFGEVREISVDHR